MGFSQYLKEFSITKTSKALDFVEIKLQDFEFDIFGELASMVASTLLLRILLLCFSFLTLPEIKYNSVCILSDRQMNADSTIINATSR